MCVNVRLVVDTILARCRRYFMQEAVQHQYELVNLCAEEAVAFADETAFSIAVMNCVKNSIDAYRERHTEGTKSIVVSCRDEGQAPHDACVVSVVDDAGGIPPEVTRRLGQVLFTTKGERGTGLGMCNVGDAMGRLGGRTVLATACHATARAPLAP